MAPCCATPPPSRRRRRRRRAYAPTSKTASHNNHEKINSWALSFTFTYEYGAPLDDPSGRRVAPLKKASALACYVQASHSFVFNSDWLLRKLREFFELIFQSTGLILIESS